MKPKSSIKTDKAPAPIGTYSQAVKTGNTLYVSGQIPLDPESMQVVRESFSAAANQVFCNLKAIAEAAGSSLSDTVKLNISLRDLANFPVLNEIMAEYFTEPYPARAVVGVTSLPMDVDLEIEAVLVTT